MSITQSSSRFAGKSWPPSFATPLLILAAACISMMLAFGFRNSFGIFLAPVSTELGWGREVLGLAFAIQNLMWGISQPFAGYFAERYGSGRVIFCSGLVYIVGLVGSAFMSTPFEAILFAGVFVGIGLGGTSNAIILSVVARTTSPERRSLVMGIATAAASGGQFLIVPLALLWMNTYSWQSCLVAFSIAGVLILLISPILSGKPAEQAAGTPQQSIGEALKEAFAQPAYIYLLAGFFVCGFHVTFIGLHLPGYLVLKGESATIGAWAISLIGGGNIIGAIMAGYLGGFLSKKYLLSGIYFGRGVVIAAFLILPVSLFSIFGFAFLMGLLWLSTVPLTSGLVGQIFGMRYMATLFGLVFFSHQVGSYLGSWLGGYFYDRTGSYDMVWYISIALAIFAGLIHWPIKEAPLERLQPA